MYCKEKPVGFSFYSQNMTFKNKNRRSLCAGQKDVLVVLFKCCAGLSRMVLLAEKAYFMSA